MLREVWIVGNWWRLKLNIWKSSETRMEVLRHFMKRDSLHVRTPTATRTKFWLHWMWLRHEEVPLIDTTCCFSVMQNVVHAIVNQTLSLIVLTSVKPVCRVLSVSLIIPISFSTRTWKGYFHNTTVMECFFAHPHISRTEGRFSKFNWRLIGQENFLTKPNIVKPLLAGESEKSPIEKVLSLNLLRSFSISYRKLFQ